MVGLISLYHETTAESASKDIDAEDIIAAVNSVKDELSGLSDLEEDDDEFDFDSI